PFVADLWLLRAAAALELDYPEMGWIAKYQLDQLGMMDSDDPTFRRIMAQLERKHWLDKMPGIAAHQDDWSVARMRIEAQDGNAVGQLALCYAYLTQKEQLAQSDPQGSSWCQKAAEQGSAVAASQLAWIYGEGRGVPRDPAEAMRWNVRSAS